MPIQIFIPVAQVRIIYLFGKALPNFHNFRFALIIHKTHGRALTLKLILEFESKPNVLLLKIVLFIQNGAAARCPQIIFVYYAFDDKTFSI